LCVGQHPLTRVLELLGFQHTLLRSVCWKGRSQGGGYLKAVTAFKFRIGISRGSQFWLVQRLQGEQYRSTGSVRGL